MKRLSTAQYFRRHLLLATLTGESVRIEDIRPNEINPGLRDYEVSFLRLLENLTNGSNIEISYTGTTVVYRPGLLFGGEVEASFPASRGIGYFLEPVLLLAPFCKQKLTLTCHGTTSHPLDPSVDVLRTVHMPVLANFGIEYGLELRVFKRAFPPASDGEVVLTFPHQIKTPKTQHALKPARIRKIRGVASSTRISASTVNRAIEAARGVLNPLVSDVYIYSDVSKGSKGGYGLSLVAESRNGTLYTCELVAEPEQTPEDLGRDCAFGLLDEMRIGGCVGRHALELALIMMVLGSTDVGRLRIGKEAMDTNTISLLRDLKVFTGVQARVVPFDDNDLVVSMLGCGFVNANKKIQ